MPIMGAYKYVFGAMEEEAVGRDAILAEGSMLGVSSAPLHRPRHAPTRPDKARRLSYKAKQDSTYKYYKIILVDAAANAIRNDPKINWICKGVPTPAGKKYRCLRGKGHLHHKARPSRRATWQRNQTPSLRRYR